VSESLSIYRYQVEFLHPVRYLTRNPPAPFYPQNLAK
jgi:hypothetical protein